MKTVLTLLLLFATAMPAIATEPDGTITSFNKKKSFISTGDEVYLELNNGVLMAGDQFFIYQAEGRGSGAKIGKGVVLHAVEDGNGIGIITSTTIEVKSGGSFWLPIPATATPYSSAMKKMAEAKLNLAIKSGIAIAITTFRKEDGTVTEGTETATKAAEKAICKKAQFRCASSEAVGRYMKEHTIFSGNNMPWAVRAGLANHFALQLLFTAVVKADGTLLATIYDLQKNSVSEPEVIKSNILPVGKTLQKAGQNKHLFWQLQLAKEELFNKKAVTALATVDFSKRLNKQYSKHLGINMIEPLLKEIKINNVQVEADGNGLIFADTVLAGRTTIAITLLPTLKGSGGVVIGEAVTKKITIELPENSNLVTEIGVKRAGNGAMIVIDTNYK